MINRDLVKDRDCDNCENHSKNGCEVWSCKFNPKNYRDFVCDECEYLTMYYDVGLWENYACMNEDARGTDDPFMTACKYFEMTEEARRDYFERLNNNS